MGNCGSIHCNLSSIKKSSTVVYEKELKIGESRHGDFEGIENWIFNNHIYSSFKNIGFDFNKIESTPVNSFYVHTAHQKPLRVKSKIPFSF